MRSLTRLVGLPPTLQPTGSGGTQHQSNNTLHRQSPSNSKSFPAHWNQPDVRGLLYATHWRVCAYCGRHLPGNDRGDVEHFRPKSAVQEDPAHGGYWWLAYNLANYLLSCSICNTHRKGNRFPLAPRARRVTFATRRRLAGELRLLCHPLDDPLDSWLQIDWKDVDLVPVRAAPGLPRALNRRVDQTIDFFRINRDIHLLKERRNVLDRVTQALEENKHEAVRTLAVRYSPQSAVAVSVIQEVAPHLLPDPQFERDWLLTQISRELELITRIREQTPLDQRSQLDLEESLWMVAALWHNAALPNQQLADWCDAHGVLDQVQEMAKQFQ